MFLPITIII